MKKTTLSLTAIASVLSASVGAQDVRGFSRDMPTRLKDAFPTRYRAGNLQLTGTFQRSGGEDQFDLEPELKYGIVPDWEITAAIRLVLSGDRGGSGDVTLGALWGRNDIDEPGTAFALGASAILPTGEDSEGLDGEIEGIITHPLVLGPFDTRAHANLAWLFNGDAGAGEDETGYRVIFGVSRRLNPDTLAIVDFVREQSAREGSTTNLFELGLKRSLGQSSALALGAGFGIGEDSPPTRFVLAFQASF